MTDIYAVFNSAYTWELCIQRIIQHVTEITKCELTDSPFYHFSAWQKCRLLKFFYREDKDLFGMHNQYHGCWCLGDTRSQDISSHSVGLVCQEDSGIITTRVNLYIFCATLNESLINQNAISWSWFIMPWDDCMYLGHVQLIIYEVINYHQTSNISHTLVGNKIVDHSDVVGASPVGTAPTTSSFST